MRPAATGELERALRTAFDGVDGSIRFEPIANKGWTSITFAGERHRVRLRIDGAQAQPAADAFLADLPDREFMLRGHLLADIALVEEVRDGSGASLILDVLTVEAD